MLRDTFRIITVAMTKIAMSGRSQRMSRFCIITSSFISYGRQVQCMCFPSSELIYKRTEYPDNVVLCQIRRFFHTRYKRIADIADFLLILIEKYYCYRCHQLGRPSLVCETHASAIRSSRSLTSEANLHNDNMKDYISL